MPAPGLKRLNRMMLRGQLIVNGGGLTIRQLPSGQMELAVDPNVLNVVRQTGRSLSNGDSGESSATPPGEPQPFAPPTPVLPPVPVLPERPDVSGEYGGPSSRGRKIKGATSDEKSGLDAYDFNQKGWQHYLW